MTADCEEKRIPLNKCGKLVAAKDPGDLNSLDKLLRRRLGLLTRAQFDHRRLAVEEISKYSQSKMVSLASVLTEGVAEKNYQKWGHPGIRVQLLDITKKKLEMDLVLEDDHHSKLDEPLPVTLLHTTRESNRPLLSRMSGRMLRLRRSSLMCKPITQELNKTLCRDRVPFRGIMWVAFIKEVAVLGASHAGCEILIM